MSIRPPNFNEAENPEGLESLKGQLQKWGKAYENVGKNVISDGKEYLRLMGDALTLEKKLGQSYMEATREGKTQMVEEFFRAQQPVVRSQLTKFKRGGFLTAQEELEKNLIWAKLDFLHKALGEVPELPGLFE